MRCAADIFWARNGLHGLWGGLARGGGIGHVDLIEEVNAAHGALCGSQGDHLAAIATFDRFIRVILHGYLLGWVEQDRVLGKGC